MAVRPDPRRTGWWIIDCRPGGYQAKRERIAYRGSREAALKWEAAIMGRRTEQMAKVRTIREIFSLWIVNYQQRRSAETVISVRMVWRSHLAPAFGALPVAAITRQAVERYKSARLAEGVKHRTINKELSYFSAMITWAAKMDYCPPCPINIEGFEAKLTRAPRPAVLSPDELAALVAHMPERLRVFVLLMADAGLRRTEALSLTGEQIFIEQGLIHVTGKGNKQRVAATTTARPKRELEQCPATGPIRINPRTRRPYIEIRASLSKAARAAGITRHVNHHLLRHTAGTMMTLAGLDQRAIQLQLGHATIQTSTIYQHTAGAYLKEQGKKMERLIGEK